MALKAASNTVGGNSSISMQLLPCIRIFLQHLLVKKNQAHTSLDADTNIMIKNDFLDK